MLLDCRPGTVARQLLNVRGSVEGADLGDIRNVDRTAELIELAKGDQVGPARRIA